MQDFELIEIRGGAIRFNSTLLNAVSRLLNTITDLGRTVGTSIRMITSGRRC